MRSTGVSSSSRLCSRASGLTHVRGYRSGPGVGLFFAMTLSAFARGWLGSASFRFHGPGGLVGQRGAASAQKFQGAAIADPASRMGRPPASATPIDNSRGWLLLNVDHPGARVEAEPGARVEAGRRVSCATCATWIRLGTVTGPRQIPTSAAWFNDINDKCTAVPGYNTDFLWTYYSST